MNKTELCVLLLEKISDTPWHSDFCRGSERCSKSYRASYITIKLHYISIKTYMHNNFTLVKCLSFCGLNGRICFVLEL